MKDFDNKILDKYFNKYYSSSAKDDYKSWLAEDPSTISEYI
jgi:hypothetical protein